MKVKPQDEIISVQRLTEDQIITVLTHKGMSLTYNTNELSDTGLRAAGVKSINLKVEDFVVMTEVVEAGQTIIMATQRGAMKRIDFKVLQLAKRGSTRYYFIERIKEKSTSNRCWSCGNRKSI